LPVFIHLPVDVVLPFFWQKVACREEVISSGDSLVVHPVPLEAPRVLPKL